MYSSYTSATLALRAKASFSYTHISVADHHPERPRCRSRCCCTATCESATWLPLYSVSINPRSVYGFHLRQSSLLHWSPSRTLFSAAAAAAAARYRRCAAAERAAGYGEMIGILAEVEGHFWDISPRDFGCLESHWEEEIEIEKKPRTKMHDFGSNSLRKESSLAKRRNGLRPECPSEVKEGGRRRVRGQLSSSYGNRVVDVEKEVREVNKYEVSAVEKRHMDSYAKATGNAKASSSSKIYEVETRDGKEEEEESRGGYQEVTRKTDVRDVDMEKVYGRVNVASEAREEYDRGERMWVVGRRESREGSRNAFGSMNSSREVQEESVIRGRKGAEQMELREESHMVTRASTMHEDDRKMLSRSMDAARREREEYIRGEKHSFGQRESSEEYQKIAGVSEVRQSDTQGTSSKSVVDTRLVDNGASSSSIVQHHSYVDNRVAGRTTSNRSSQRVADISEIQDSDIKRASSHSQRHFQEMRTKDSEDISTSAQITRDKRTQINMQEIESIDIDRQHMYNTNVTTAQVTGIQRETSSRSHADTTTGDQVDYTTSTVNLVHDVREEQNQSRQQVLQQRSSRKDSERTMDSSQYSRGSMEMISNPREATDARTDKRKETSSVFARNKRAGRGPFMGESSQSSETRTAHSASLSSGSSYIQAATSGLNDQISRDEIYLAKADVMESVRRSDKSSAMYLGEFVDRLQQELSSSDTVDDVAREYSRSQTDKLQQQTGQSSVAISGGIDSTSERKEKKLIQESARQSSSRSGPKGPSDEMWDVRSLYPEEPSRRVELGENASSKGVTDSTNASEKAESSITRRAHRSLWTYVADIIRKSWHTNVETHNSTIKSGTRSSSNESVGSEAWFSGHEPDENDDETEQGGRDGDTNESVANKKAADQYPVSSPGKSEASRPVASIAMLEGSTSTLMGSMERGPLFEDASRVSRPEHLGSIEGEGERQGVASRFATVDQSSPSTGITASDIVEEENTEVEMPESTSTSMGSMGRRPLSKVASLLSRPEHLGVIEGEREKQGVSSRVATVDQSSSLTSVTLSATSEGEITELVMLGSGSAKLGEEHIRGKLPDIGGIEEKDGELKRRKFQRNNQVTREQFDEWEEAYKHETEQRKVDEFFMREAILEAKKAADMWEVPVGAVLVQSGKIIARGCNLVEESRDSTAHAEMICIREASNLLRTWRLSETTLYVTLEPCAMCAGAILQARIDTVVWGAPNKLLGADGSWVRLFPGDGGSNNLDPSNQMAGPVHPFHPKITIRRAILSTECADVMQQFFQLRRKNKKREPSPPSCLPLSTHRPKLFTKMHDIFCMMFCL